MVLLRRSVICDGGLPVLMVHLLSHHRHLDTTRIRSGFLILRAAHLRSGGCGPFWVHPEGVYSGIGARVAPVNALAGTSAGATGAPVACTVSPSRRGPGRG